VDRYRKRHLPKTGAIRVPLCATASYPRRSGNPDRFPCHPQNVDWGYMNIAVLLISLITSGLLVGNELAVALFIHPVLYSLPDQVHARAAKPLAKRLGRYMPFWYALSLVFAILQLLMSPRDTSAAWWPCCVAVILLALIIVLTILLPVPINNRIAGLDLDRLPDDWMNMRRLWDRYHRVRVLLLCVSLALLILSALANHRT
jgi:hypothetical protein